MLSHSSIPSSPTKPASSTAASSTLTPSSSIKKSYSHQRGAGILLDSEVGRVPPVPILKTPIPRKNEDGNREKDPEIGQAEEKDRELSAVPILSTAPEKTTDRVDSTSEDPTTPVKPTPTRSTSIPSPIITNLSSKPSPYPPQSTTTTTPPTMSSTAPYTLGPPMGDATATNSTTATDSAAAADPVVQAAAATHPNSTTHKMAEQKVIGEELAKDGTIGNEKTDGGLGEVVVHTFDPDAPTAAKAASAGQGAGTLAPRPAVITTDDQSTHSSVGMPGGIVGGIGSVRSAMASGAAGGPHPISTVGRAAKTAIQPGASLEEAMADGSRAITMDLGPGSDVKPTASLEDLDKASRAEGEGKGGVQTKPGAITTGAGAALGDSAIVGWVQSTKQSALSLTDATGGQSLNTIVSQYVSPEFYGTPYHNAGIVVFAVLATRFVTIFALGWAWIIVILAFCVTMYSLSIERTRKRARDDIERELMKVKLSKNTETVGWMNSMLHRAWLILEPVLSATIVNTVDAALQGVVPMGVESIKLTTFTLGNKAPTIATIKTDPLSPDDEIEMEWDLSFVPHDLEDLTRLEAQGKVNPKIVLSIKVGKGPIAVGMPILLEDISFKGKLWIKARLMTNFPHVKNVEIAFITKPDFDYVLKPLGGETFGMDINSIPGLESFIKDQVHNNLGPMMYKPNTFKIDLEQLLSGTPLDSAIGVLKVTVESARGLKAVKFGGDAPDPYVTMALGVKPPVGRTKVVDSTTNPTWQENQFLLVNSLAESLHLALYDYNTNRPDSLLGTVSHDLTGLAEDAEQEGIVGTVLSGGKDRGQLRYSLSYYPVLVPSKRNDGTLTPPPDSNTGIVRLTIHQAKDLDLARFTTPARVCPYVKVYLGATQQIHRTPTHKNDTTPIWESHTEYLVADKHNSTVTLRVLDDRGTSQDPTLGQVTAKLMDLLAAKERQQDWFPLSKAKSGKIRMTVDWKPLGIAGALHGAAAYVPPIGIMRILLKSALDVKNVEAALSGKSDPYTRVLLNNQVIGRTDTVNNNVNPEWDQIVYVPVHSARERLLLEVMDYQNIGKDRSLGSVELVVSEYVSSQGTQRNPYVSSGPQDHKDPVRLDGKGTFKGHLLYRAEFVPAVSLRGGVSFKPAENELQAAAKQMKTVAEEGATATPLTNRSIRGSVRESVKDKDSVKDSLKDGESKAGGEATEAEKEETGVVMTPEEILATQSGVLVVQVMSGQLSKRGRFEVLLDEAYWPSFSTSMARSHKQTWDSVHEAFVRELDFSRITLRLNEEDDPEDKEQIFATLQLQTKDVLEQCLESPMTYTLDTFGGGERNQITLNARFVPVDIKLEPRESINNMGSLRVMLIDGKDIPAADRSGKSDPYAVFTLNGVKAYKSDHKKKTLAPVWNETFSVRVPSRVAAEFGVELFDWNQLQQAVLLGTGVIDLATLEPFIAEERVVRLSSVKNGEKGTIRINLLFQPEVIMRERKNTSTFSNAGRTMTMVGTAPISVGKGVGKGVFHGGKGVVQGVGSVGGFAGRHIGLIKKKDNVGDEVLADEEVPNGGVTVQDFAVADHPGSVLTSTGAGNGHAATATSTATDTAMASAFTEGTATSTMSESGMLSVTCVSAKGLPAGSHEAKAYLQLKLGDRSQKTGHGKASSEPEWNETLRFPTTGDTASLSVKLYDHKTLGKDKELGEAVVDVRKYLEPSSSGAEELVTLTDGHTGVLLKFEFEVGPAKDSRMRSPSIHSKGGSANNSPSKFSMTKK